MNPRTAISRRARSLRRDGELLAAACGLGPPGAIARKLRAQGVPARRYETAVSAHLHLLPDWLELRGGLFVDLGAFVGGWTAAVLGAVPGASVLAVEPLPESFAGLTRRFAGEDRVRLENVAVDRQRGEAVFHLGREAVFGSLLEFDPAMRGLYGTSAETTGTITVPTAPLDDLVRGPVRVLKIDVQGAELQAFAGAERTLQRTDAVVAEALLAEHYRGGSTFASLYEALTSRGFVFWDMERPYRDPEGRALWVDVSFVRPRAAPPEQAETS